MALDPRIPLQAAQAAQFNLGDLLQQHQQRQAQQQQMEMQREGMDLRREEMGWQREMQQVEMDAAKKEAAEAGLKDMAAAVQWADTPEKWAQVQQHYGQIDPQLATVPFQARETALVRLGQMGEYLKNTQPDPAKSSSFLTELDALGIPRDSQAAKDLFFGKNSPAGYLLKPGGGAPAGGNRKTVGGKTYVKQGDQWFEEGGTSNGVATF